MGSQGYAKKRPCSVCRRWFMPHPRLKDRQRTCVDPGCKKEWHRKQCAEWNKRNADYFRANYLQKKLEPEPKKVQVKSRLKSGLPLRCVQEAIGMQHLVIIEYLAQLMARRFQEVIRRQAVVNTEKTRGLSGNAFSRCDGL